MTCSAVRSSPAPLASRPEPSIDGFALARRPPTRAYPAAGYGGGGATCKRGWPSDGKVRSGETAPRSAARPIPAPCPVLPAPSPGREPGG
jgi:hypothetical protein